MSEGEIYSLISGVLQEDQEVISLAEKGSCRTWTEGAIKCIKKYCSDREIEAEIRAVEVEIEPELLHTFIKIFVGENEPYLCDGTGVGKYDPYFGYEENAPRHLRDSKDDMINCLL